MDFQYLYTKTEGRISLAVDFPLEGHVYHFQKLKANAVLEIGFADPKGNERWRNAGLFGVLAVILAGLSKRSRQFLFRRSAAH